MAVKRVILIRPGETTWNKMGRWQGIVQVPLDDHGRAQATRLAHFIRNIGIEALYSSDLRRARDTAEIISEKLGFDPHYEQRLRERNMGQWQGLTLREIMDWYPDEYDRLLQEPHTYQIPGGESRRQVASRVSACFEDIVGRGGDVVGIISHTTSIKTLLADLVPECEPYDMSFSNMSVTTIKYINNDHWEITQLDDITHLEGMGTFAIPEVEEKEQAGETG
jgi:broad specificity phosphatase PhoE